MTREMGDERWGVRCESSCWEEKDIQEVQAGR